MRRTEWGVRAVAAILMIVAIIITWGNLQAMAISVLAVLVVMLSALYGIERSARRSGDQTP